MAGACVEKEEITAGYREHSWISGAQQQGEIGVLNSDVETAALDPKKDTLNTC